MIRSDRNVFVGVHVTRRVKDALVRVCAETNTNQSAFVASLIEEDMKVRGALNGTQSTRMDGEVPLPLEGETV